MASTMASAATASTRQIGGAVDGWDVFPACPIISTLASTAVPRNALYNLAMAESSNIREVTAWLRAVVEGWSFQRPGIDQSLGRDLCHVIADGIAERSSQGQDASGALWLANDPLYAAIKARHYGWPDPPPVNYRTGQMLSHLSLLGSPEVGEREIMMRYGIGESPGATTWSPADNRTPGMRKSDAFMTDVEKAEIAHVDGRGFYEADDAIEKAVIEAAGEALDTYLQEVN